MNLLGKLFVLLLCASCGGNDGEGGNGNPDGGSDNDGPSGNACERVDLLIAVDTSGSMAQELTAFRETVFPAMATSLLDIGEGLEDFRTGLVDACPRPANLHEIDKAGDSCNFASGNRWIESSSVDFTDEFVCVGDVNTDYECSTGNGSDEDEQPVEAAIAALNDVGNDGFVRDSSLLVVIAITDEDECNASGEDCTEKTAVQLKNDLQAAKENSDHVVFVGVGGGSGGCDNGAYGSADHAQLLEDVVDQFGTRGVFWDLCQGQLEDRLSNIVSVIEDACEDFVVN